MQLTLGEKSDNIKMEPLNLSLLLSYICDRFMLTKTTCSARRFVANLEVFV